MADSRTKRCTGCGKRRRLSSFIGKEHKQPCRPCDRDRKREKRPETREADNARNRAGHPERYRGYDRKGVLGRYGLTLEQYDAMLAVQGGVCAICKQPEGGKLGLLYVDHNHAADRVRGLLCNRCNLSIGKFDDDPALLRAAADYLEAHSCRSS